MEIIKNDHGSIKLKIVNGCMFICDLESDSKNVGSMSELIGAAKAAAKDRGFDEVYLTIESSNPKMNRLAKVYMKRYKAEPVAIILKSAI